MKKILFSIILVVGLSGCSDFLEPDSPSEYVPETADALNEMLLGEAYPKATTTGLFSLHGALDDDIEMSDVYIAQRTTSAIENLRLVYSWDPEMYDLYESGTNAMKQWKTYYQFILGTNAALDYLSDVTGSVEDKAYVAAQAYALRAFFYFNLVNLFGEPYNYNKAADGVPLKLASGLSDNYEKRATVGEVYEQIIKDLNEAEKNFLTLPEASQNKASYRINLPAVELLHARVCLHMEDMEGAAKYARKVIEDWDYSLYDLKSFIKVDEIVAGVDASYPNYVSLENPETIWAYGSASDFVSTIGLADYMEDGKTLAYMVNASQGLIDCFEEEDLRKTLYLVQELRGADNAQPKDLKPAEGHYLPWSKCIMNYNNSVKYNTVFGMSFRLSEAYLILAEAVYNTDEELALRMINELREKRYAEGKNYEVNYSGEELLNFIREERRRELCFEGQRWFDLRRYGMPSFKRRWIEYGDYLGNYVIEKEDAAYTLPISSDVIERNPALKQNRLTTKKILQ